MRATERVIVLQDVQEMLERDVGGAVDMRLAERPTIRMSEGAVEEWWRVDKNDGRGKLGMIELYESQRAMRHMRKAAMQRGVVAVLDVGTSKDCLSCVAV